MENIANIAWLYWRIVDKLPCFTSFIESKPYHLCFMHRPLSWLLSYELLINNL